METEKLRGIIKMMSAADKATVLGGGPQVRALNKPKLERTDFGSALLPYAAVEPSELALGCTFSPELCVKVASAHIGSAVENREAFAGVVRAGVIRDPMSVSASEYFSEDPHLTAELLKSFSTVNGMGFIFTDCLGQGRFVNRTVDARALRELYLLPLIQVGKFAAALQLDGGYLNGQNVCTSNVIYDLYTQYVSADAMVFTQYGSADGDSSDAVMGNGGSYLLGIGEKAKRSLSYDVMSGLISESKLNRAVERTMGAIVNAHEVLNSPVKPEYASMPVITYDSTVLLKNDGILPTGGKKLTLFGDAEYFRDGRSSGLMPISSAAQNLGSLNVFFVTEYERDGISAETATAIGGAIAAAPTVVVLCGGCATPLKTAANANALLFCPSHPLVREVVQMLATTSPRGRLPFSWCASPQDYPCNNKKFAARGDFRYESMYNGYMLFNNFARPAVYPFGHGLEYTRYEISKLNVSAFGTKIDVDFIIKNTGEYAGYAVVQIYVTLLNAPVYGLSGRLAAFKRIKLDKTENARISLSIEMSEFAVYDENADNSAVVGGKYRVDVGMSSKDIRASAECKVGAGSRSNAGLSQKLAPSYYRTGSGFAPTAPEIEKLLKVPFIKKPDEYPELDPPPAAAVKRAIKKVSKTVPKHLMPLIEHKICTTPLKNGLI